MAIFLGALVDILTACFAWLVRALIAAAPFLIARVVAAIGLAIVTNEFLVDPLLGLVKTTLSGAPALALTVVHAAGFDQAIVTIFAAYTIRTASKFALLKKAAA